ncbi:hypothetical protein Poli38472_009954 [Pythium oligandrum]|uniref:Uncharacterized protein n=1 Tax=Pythium oligandrum TaxID=41045 RepID=A0A8K1FCJ9_PYTOL|nr:hypothetical protein Poli38472_009954 [Pythium oligandrum]|eukprot:TMW58395.1 hypothetical protein Poli38472_009954 [Pythium oligandrum]
MKIFLTAASALLFASSVDAHASLVTPASREGGKETFADERNVVGCGKPGPGPVTQVRAGSEIPVMYYRNNHVGGFIRWSIIKRGEPETRENFDKNVFYYTCRESGNDCKPRNGRPYTRWQEAYDGTDNFVIPCGDKIRIPDYLADGDYVLQYTNFATGHNNGDPGLALPIYRSCADLHITGGSASKPRPKCPTFVGGDRVTKAENLPSDQCYYFHSNDIPNAVFREGNAPNYDGQYKFGRPADIDRCIAAGQNRDLFNVTETEFLAEVPSAIHAYEGDF